MNVDGAFIRRKHAGIPQCFFLLTTACRYISDISLRHSGRCLSQVSHCHTALKKKANDEYSVSAQNFLALWTLNTGAASSSSAVRIHAICACFRKHNIL